LRYVFELRAFLEPLALPSEAHDFNGCKLLAGGLGNSPGIVLQSVSADVPKLLAAAIG
jgi:hypothetical protein